MFKCKHILVFLFFVSFLARFSFADILIAPPDLDDVLNQIATRQKNTLSSEANAKIILKDDEIVFTFPFKNVVISDSFGAKTPDVIRHIQVQTEKDGYRFVAILKHTAQEYKNLIRQVNDQDALIFFNDKEIIVYTPNVKDGHMELQQWIYAREPNSSEGSRWEWIFKSESWEWPMTMAAGEKGEMKINRNLPVPPFFTIDRKAKDQHLLNMMIKFKSDDPIKQYFPFPEEICTLPPAKVLNKEGIQKNMDIHVSNSPVINPNRPKPKHGLDFNAWDDYWQSIYTESVKAEPNEYPLLVGPF
jgi:hypothetical protein